MHMMPLRPILGTETSKTATKLAETAYASDLDCELYCSVTQV